jgi:FAD/FMN-containing dehydrogenase
MSSKVAHYLQQHLMGEVMTSADALKYFSTDGSVFTKKPKIIVYPRNTSDVRKTARFTWQLAEKGHVMPITARGKGTDQAGAALGDGVMMVFPAHMNKILELDKNSVTVQPGIIYSKLEQTLHTHGRFLPPYPSSAEFSTIGGAVANNAAGEKTVKYGQMRKYTQALQVVLANGELIKTGRIKKRELNKIRKKDTFEAHIYRELEKLILENQHTIESAQLKVSKNSAGYALSQILKKDGSMDLTPLFVGSQGTLGIVTQATIKTEPYNPSTTLLVGYFENLKEAQKAVTKLLETNPSALEMVDQHLLNFVKKHHPEQLRGIVSEPYPQIILLCEYDDISDRTQKNKTKKAKKILLDHAIEFRVTKDEHEKETLWKIRHSAAAVIWQVVGSAKALPIIEDGIVPRSKLEKYVEGVYEIFDKYKLEAALWGHAGDANMHMQPFLDLGKVTDRQKAFKIMEDYYNMVLDLGGSTSGEHSDGRLRAPFLPKVYGPQMYKLFQDIKELFDPHGTLNPGVKIDVTMKDLVPLLRKEYSMEHLFDHMPRG